MVSELPEILQSSRKAHQRFARWQRARINSRRLSSILGLAIGAILLSRTMYLSRAFGPEIFNDSAGAHCTPSCAPGSSLHLEPTGVPPDDSNAIYLTDMKLCEPRSAITKRFRQWAWKAIEYETATFKGSMLYSIPGLHSPDLTCKLNQKGWYAIYLGTHNSFQRYRVAYPFSPILKIKLSGDEFFTYVESEFPRSGNSHHEEFSATDLTEVFWRPADLTGQNLIISATGIADANISYIKLVPLNAADVSALASENGRHDTRRLMATFDVSGMTYVHRDRDGILSELAAFRDSDVGIVLWGTCVGLGCYYPTKVGEPPKREAVPADCYGFSALYPRSELLLDVKVNGRPIDPLREVVEYGHRLGLQMYASIRPEGPLDAPDDENTGKFYDNHPEFLCRSRAGYPLAHLSLAYPEVRQKWIELFREQVRYGADGINFVFARGEPFVGYDQPAIDGFKEQYGVDPRSLDDNDARWLKFSAAYVTQFLREIRQMLDDEAKRLGRSRLGTAYHAVRSPEASLRLGLDVKTWIGENLVDYLVAYPAESPEILQAFLPLTKGSRCQLYADVLPRNLTAEDWLVKAQAMYAAGAAGLAMWDTDSRIGLVSEWSLAKKLGHRDELKSWKVEPRRYFRVVPLRKLGGRVVDRFYQTNG